MKLWTVWQDYGATGEGRTLMARIAYAQNAQEAVAGFGQGSAHTLPVGPRRWRACRRTK